MQPENSQQGSQHLYEVVAGRISCLIEGGTFRTGDRLPSVRSLSRQLQVSINTVMEAYTLLEDRRLIEARPQSGFYVRGRLPAIPSAPVAAAPVPSPACVSISDICLKVMKDTHDPNLVQLGGAIPNPELLPVTKLNRMLATEVRRWGNQSVAYAMPPGVAKLRRLIAGRLVETGCTLNPDEILITSGCVEAVQLALRATCRPGDTVAVESPCYYNFLQLIEEMGLKVLEIPATPQEGLSLEVLAYALEQNRVSACLAIPNFNNPLGCLMPEEKKRELVDLLARHQVPLIEDDIYGDLAFDAQRPSVAKAYDRKGLVLLCSSFSKTLAPGYRIGWVAAGRFQAEVERLKFLANIATPTPTQFAVAEFLANGGYDHHLRTLRRTYARQVAQMGAAIGRHFPAGTRVTRPSGNFVLWVELPEPFDALLLYQAALTAGISIAPGPIFSATGRYGRFIRLNAAFWSPTVEQAIATLGALATRQLAR
jgi:DNA-binding transcriptional MocR family regulator